MLVKRREKADECRETRYLAYEETEITKETEELDGLIHLTDIRSSESLSFAVLLRYWFSLLDLTEFMKNSCYFLLLQLSCTLARVGSYRTLSREERRTAFLVAILTAPEFRKQRLEKEQHRDVKALEKVSF